MCLVPLKVKSLSPCGVKYSFAPCGSCAECRRSYQNAWFFRLAVEVQAAQNKGWKIGFFTLTYNDEHLPWLDDHVNSRVACFRRSDVRRLILRLRKQYHKEFGITKIVYLIASEYGETTRRPHYHGIICFPPVLSARRVLSDIKKYWSTGDDDMVSLGFVFPSYEDYADEKFICKSAYGAAMYAAKYCCKDVAWYSELPRLNFSTFSVAEFKESKPFHMQSKSLGSGLLVNLSDEDKLKLYKQGLSFVGNDKFVSIPLYIKNKILYDPIYLTDDKGNRVVTRVASSFMRKYASVIYEEKSKFYDKFFSSACEPSFWSGVFSNKVYGNDTKRVVDFACNCAVSLVRGFGSVRACSEYYLSFYGVPVESRQFCDKVQAWLNRFSLNSVLPWCRKKDSSAFSDEMFTLLFSLFRMPSKEVAYEKMRELNSIQDFYKNNLE